MNELNDKELAQVSGGMTCEYTSLAAGDVFVQNDTSSRGVLIVEDCFNLTDRTLISCRPYTKVGSVYQIAREEKKLDRTILQNEYTYSPALSGTLPFRR